MAGGNQPNFYLAFTAKDGREYVKGPSVGMWDADKGPKARGSIKGEYLEKLIDFLRDFEDESVSVALFEQDGKGGSSRRGGRDRDEDRRTDRDRDEREERGSRRNRDEDDDGDTSKDRDRGSRRDKDDDDDGDEFGKDRESRRGSSRRESSERSSSRRSSSRKSTKKTTRKKGRK